MRVRWLHDSVSIRVLAVSSLHGMEHQRLPLLASLMALGAGVVWSFGAIMSHEASHTDAFQYLVWRSVGIIVVIEVLYLLRSDRQSPYRPQILAAWTSGRAMMLANTGVFIASLAFVYALKNTTTANAAFLGSLSPLVTVVFGRFLGERLSRSTLVALGLGLAGIVLTVYGDLGGGHMDGNIAALMSGVGFALYTITLRSNPQRDWSPAMPGYAILMVLVCSITTLALSKTLLPPLADIAWAALHGGAVIVIGTLLFNAGSKKVPAVPMTIFAQTEMVFVPIWSLVVFGTVPSAKTLAGGALIFCAVVGKALYDAAEGRRNDFTTAPDVPLL